MPVLCILVTGDPVPVTQKARGDFATLIQQTIGTAWVGTWLVVDARTETRLPDLESLAGLIVTGSPHSVTDREPWMLQAEAYLRTAVAAELAILGVCFGHQLLAEALGGRVAKNPRGREIGTFELELHGEDPVLSDPRRPYQVNMSHVDSVVELPSGARVLGATEGDPNAALRFSDKAWGVQFHPEFDREIIGHYARTRSEALTAEGLDPEQVTRSATDAVAGSGVLRRFVHTLVG